MDTDQKIIDKLTFVHIKDRKVLFVKERDGVKWLTPGGKKRVGETEHEALMREVQEELTVNLIPESIEHMETISVEAFDRPNTIVNLHCYTGDYIGEISPNSEIDEIDYFAYAHKDLAASGGQLLIDYLKKNNYID